MLNQTVTKSASKARKKSKSPGRRRNSSRRRSSSRRAPNRSKLMIEQSSLSSISAATDLSLTNATSIAASSSVPMLDESSPSKTDSAANKVNEPAQKLSFQSQGQPIASRPDYIETGPFPASDPPDFNAQHRNDSVQTLDALPESNLRIRRVVDSGNELSHQIKLTNTKLPPEENLIPQNDTNTMVFKKNEQASVLDPDKLFLQKKIRKQISIVSFFLFFFFMILLSFKFWLPALITFPVQVPTKPSPTPPILLRQRVLEAITDCSRTDESHLWESLQLYMDDYLRTPADESSLRPIIPLSVILLHASTPEAEAKAQRAYGCLHSKWSALYSTKHRSDVSELERSWDNCYVLNPSIDDSNEESQANNLVDLVPKLRSNQSVILSPSIAHQASQVKPVQSKFARKEISSFSHVCIAHLEHLGENLGRVLHGLLDDQEPTFHDLYAVYLMTASIPTANLASDRERTMALSRLLIERLDANKGPALFSRLRLITYLP